MPEYLENPRRVPRESVRCHVKAHLPSGPFETTTENIGARGCQVILPSPAQRGDAIRLVLTVPGYAEALRVDGRVAWVSPEAPWRAGVAYAAQSLPWAASWMEGARRAVPELFPPVRRAPDRVAVDAMVFLGPVPALADYTEDELVVLRTVGAGLRVAELRTALSRAWPRMQRAFFTLLSRGDVILSRAAATHPVKWKHVLGDPSRPPVESLVAAPGTTSTPAPARTPSPSATPIPTPRATPILTPRATPAVAWPGATPALTPPPLRTPPPLPTPAGASAPPQPPRAPAVPRPGRATSPDFAGAGVGWRAPARPRSAEAQAILQLAMLELQERRAHQALTLLRRALALAPGDPEIAAAIGRAMQGGMQGA